MERAPEPDGLGPDVDKIIEDVVSEVSEAHYFDIGPERKLLWAAQKAVPTFRAEPERLREHILAVVKKAAAAMISDGSVVIDVDEGDGLDPESVRKNAVRLAKEEGIPIGKAMALVHKMRWAEYDDTDDEDWRRRNLWCYMDDDEDDDFDDGGDEWDDE